MEEQEKISDTAPETADTTETTETQIARAKAADLRNRREPLWVSFFKAFIAVCVFFVVCLGIYGAWTHHQQNAFRDSVQELLDSGKGMETLRLVDDWRVEDLTETTKRVSRADGHYVVFVWYLNGEHYLVENVEK